MKALVGGLTQRITSTASTENSTALSVSQIRNLKSRAGTERVAIDAYVVTNAASVTQLSVQDRHFATIPPGCLYQTQRDTEHI
jgi:hypothetical protein